MKVIKRAQGWLLMLMMVLSMLLAPAAAYAGNDMDTRSLALINKPGVVLLQSTWYADVVIDQLSIDEGIFEVIDVAIEQMGEEGQLTGDMDQFTSIYIQIFTQLLPDYTYPSGIPTATSAQSSFIGTGFIVTPDGYLLTNAHVVETDEQTMLMGFAYDAAASYVAGEIQEFAQGIYDAMGVVPAQEDLDLLAETYYSLLIQEMQVNNLSAEYLCFMGNTIGGTDPSVKAVTLDLRKKGASIPDKDIAILKMDKTNLPTVALGDDSMIKTGDTVYAMGYPAVATVNGTLNIDQAIQEPTLTNGIISAKKQMAGGWSILQTSADIHGGNSGGPLFNESGEVVGINTFGMLEESGASASGMNFAIPISIAKQFLSEINVTSSESQFTTDYRKAVMLYGQEDYRGAADLLRQINEMNPGYPVVVELLSECSSLAGAQPVSTQEAPVTADADDVIDDEESPKQTDKEADLKPIPWLPIGLGGGGLVLVVIIIISVAAVKKRKRIQPPKPEVTAHPSTADEPDGSICPICAVFNVKGIKFCKECGGKLDTPAPTIKCQACGIENIPGTKFYGECGGKL